MRIIVLFVCVIYLSTVTISQHAGGPAGPSAAGAAPGGAAAEYEYEAAEPGQPTEFPTTTTTTTPPPTKLPKNILKPRPRPPYPRPLPPYPMPPYGRLPVYPVAPPYPQPPYPYAPYPQAPYPHAPYPRAPYPQAPYQRPRTRPPPTTPRPRPQPPPPPPQRKPYDPWKRPITFMTWNPNKPVIRMTRPVYFQLPTAPPVLTQPPPPPPTKPKFQFKIPGTPPPRPPFAPMPTTPVLTVPPPNTQPILKIRGGITTPAPAPQGSCPKFTHHISGNKIVIETIPGRCQMLLSWIPLTEAQKRRMNIISPGLATVLYKETRPRG